MKPRHWHWHIQPNPVCQSIAVWWSLKTTLSLSPIFIVEGKVLHWSPGPEPRPVIFSWLVSGPDRKERKRERETSQTVRKARKKKKWEHSFASCLVWRGKEWELLNWCSKHLFYPFSLVQVWVCEKVSKLICSQSRPAGSLFPK